jgi:tetratricopeptide (TPR) repeat protein
MGREDWYRRSTWSVVDQQDFLARLKRSRASANKAQYLRIQASYLAAAGNHTAAVELLDKLFLECPERLQLAEAHLQRALCLIELNQHQATIEEFRASLQAQRDCPNVGTTCWLQFPWFIVQREDRALYDEALAVLNEFRSDVSLTFPIDGYRYAAVRALIAEARGETDSAREFAKVALQCAEMSFSAFRYHPTVGLVEKVDPRIHGRLAALVQV